MPCVRFYVTDELGLGVELVKPEDVSLVAREDLVDPDIDKPLWKNDPSYFWAKRRRG